jgi:hypothetical protein
MKENQEGEACNTSGTEEKCTENFIQKIRGE